MISVDIRSKSFGSYPVLGPIRFQIGAGDVLGISGSSGVGKSTLLRLLAGLDPRFEGRICAPQSRAMVFQSPTLMPWRKVIDNITIPTHCRRDEALAMLERVGLGDKAEAWPGQLSLGQARRVAIARAFVGRPAMLLLDEPFASLDTARVGDLLELTKALITEFRPAVVLASHSETELAALATERMVMQGSPAQLYPLAGTRVCAGS